MQIFLRFLQDYALFTLFLYKGQTAGYCPSASQKKSEKSSTFAAQSRKKHSPALRDAKCTSHLQNKVLRSSMNLGLNRGTNQVHCFTCLTHPQGYKKTFDTMKTSQPKGSEALLLTRTQLASCHSIAAQVMDDFNRSKIVQIYLPACSEEQFKRFMKHIEEDFICLMPLARGTRALVFCEYMEDFNDEQNLLIYTLALEAVFAGKDGHLTQPYGARVYQYANYEEE